ncbi:interleukin-12 subunit beta isoform X1 [Alosa pseudoharengus]|uniref:interleukin-12 subunit beta isoform X1 n=1 Tax=Alosa pseudoharengus TaxID=34774 RepID=UPI003F88FC53
MLSSMSLVWVVAFFAVGSSLTSFPEHRQVVNRGATVILTCSTDFKGPIRWTYSPPEEDDFEVHQGSQLSLSNFDEPGKYSCWGGDRLLDSVYVFLEDTPDSTTPELNCLAETYGCSIKCSWVDPNYTAVRLRNQRDNGKWVSQSPEGTFIVSHVTDSEEMVPLKVTLEAINDQKYLQINKTFYLRNIIHPSPPKVLWRKKGDVLEVDVNPADTWAKPTSYYPLEYQIEYKKTDNGETVKQLCCNGETADCWHKAKCQVHVRVSKFRVRSRDPLVHRDWESGEWTSWENVMKKRRKRKNGENKKNNRKQDRKNGEKRKAGKGENPGLPTSL